MAKGNHCITIDNNKWEALGIQINGSKSAWIEHQIDILLNIDDEESKLLKNISEYENKLNIAKDKLCLIRKQKKMRLESEEILEKAMISINRIHNKQGMVGRNQIRHIARRHNIPAEKIENHCKELNLKIENYEEVPKADSQM